MSGLEWIEKETAIEVHRLQLELYGGLAGIRDENLLDSALARPLNLAAYVTEDIAVLAVAYAHGIIRNHPFVDGNKRTGHVLMETFLELNGFGLEASNKACEPQILGFAAGNITEDMLVAFVGRHLVEY